MLFTSQLSQKSNLTTAKTLLKKTLLCSHVYRAPIRTLLVQCPVRHVLRVRHVQAPAPLFLPPAGRVSTHWQLVQPARHVLPVTIAQLQPTCQSTVLRDITRRQKVGHYYTKYE